MTTTAVSNLDPETEALAQQLVTTIQEGDVEGWVAAFAPDGVIWQPHSDNAILASENGKMLRMLHDNILSELRYEDVHRYAIDGGYVQQHTLRITAKNGDTMSCGVCVVAKVVDGRVQRMDEYLDSKVIQFSMAHAPGA